LTPIQPVTDVVHGVRLTDPFRWLEDKTAPAVRQWTRAQHDATMQWLDANAPSPAGLRDELGALIDRTIVSPPQFYKGQMFFTKKQKGDAQAKLYTRLADRDILLFDPVALDASGKTAISGWSFSRHDNTMSIAVQRAGAEITTAHFVDRSSGTPTHTPLVGVSQLSFAAKRNEVLFSIRTKALIDQQRPLHAYKLTLGEPIEKAQRTVENDDAKNIVYRSEDERSPFAVIGRGDFYARTLYVEPLSGGARQPLFVGKKAFAETQVVGNVAYIRTNDGAPNFRLERVDLRPDGTQLSRRDVIRERPDAVLLAAVPYKNYIITRERHNVQTVIGVYDQSGAPSPRLLTPPEPGDVAAIAYDHNADQLYVTMTTFNAPATVYRIERESWKWTKVFQDESVVDTSQIDTRRFDVPARDGKTVPIFVSMKRGTHLDGNQPVVLYGYGGFNLGMNVRYLGSWAPLINRGVIFVEAGIRGGNESGEAWHQDGMRFKKQNTFNDFIDTAQWLITNKYTNPNRLGIYGGSNGGLLVGAVAAQRPDLFKAVVCSVPLLDMVRFHKFLIARYWIPEYGDPEQADDFRNILAYSPYHNVRAGVELPTMLVIAGENDTRVDPLHAKKFVALAQNNIGQKNPVLLKMDFDSGHGSGKSTQQQIDDREVWMRFFFNQLTK
jgi:prolyl oligopeptidase